MTDTNDDDSDSDEWGTEELVIPPKGEAAKGNGEGVGAAANRDGGGDDDYWKVEPTANTNNNNQDKTSSAKDQFSSNNNDSGKGDTDDGGEPMIIVDVTQIDPNVHSKFDRNSVNDSEAASAIRKKIEGGYTNYAKNGVMISDGTVIPCGSSVWRGALSRLRDERPGHYFVPIFPPKKG
jgi:hypothetical protein